MSKAQEVGRGGAGLQSRTVRQMPFATQLAQTRTWGTACMNTRHLGDGPGESTEAKRYIWPTISLLKKTSRDLRVMHDRPAEEILDLQRPSHSGPVERMHHCLGDPGRTFSPRMPVARLGEAVELGPEGAGTDQTGSLPEARRFWTGRV